MHDNHVDDWGLKSSDDIIEELAAPAYIKGPDFRDIRDAEILRKALDPSEDVFDDIVIRDQCGAIIGFQIGATSQRALYRMSRVKTILSSFEPTNTEDSDALRRACVRFGVQRHFPKNKRERTR